MPNFTNKAKLKKPLGTEYFNINDMNENMDKIEDEFYTPNYSEELLNEDITSFKVGTGKVDGVFKDYSNEMEQSLISIDNVKGRTVKENNTLKSIKLDISNGLNSNITDIELNSLPHDVYDILKNGIVTKKIIKMTFNELSVYDIVDTGWETKANTKAYKIIIPNINKAITSGAITGISSNYQYVSQDTIYTNDVISFATSATESAIFFRVDKMLDTVEKLKNHLAFSEEKNQVVALELKTPIQEHVNTSILAISGDTIVIDSPINFNCTHKVQLNTKAQIEELQEVLQKEKKGILYKIKDLINCSYHIGENGYIRFPDYFGGLTLQWGAFIDTTTNVGTIDRYIKLPVSSTNTIRAFGNYGTANNQGDYKGVINIMHIDLTEIRVVLAACDSNRKYEVRWFTIGR